MPRVRQPTQLQAVKGAYKTQPGRRPKQEPVGGEFDPKPPRGYTRDEKIVWDEAYGLMPPGVLQAQDRMTFEIMVRLMTRHRKAKGLISSADMTKLIKCLTELGMTPASRGRVVAGKQKDKGDGWDQA